MDGISMIIARRGVGRLVNGLRKCEALPEYFDVSDHNKFVIRYPNTFDFGKTVSGRPILHYLNRAAYYYALLYYNRTGNYNLEMSVVLMYKFSSYEISNEWLNTEGGRSFWLKVDEGMRRMYGTHRSIDSQVLFTCETSINSIMLGMVDGLPNYCKRPSMFDD